MTGPFAADCHVDGDVPCAVGVGCAGPVVLGVGVGVVGGAVEQERELHSGRHRFDLDCPGVPRSEEHTSELQSLMRISYAVFCLKKKNNHDTTQKITLNPASVHTTYVNEQSLHLRQLITPKT